MTRKPFPIDRRAWPIAFILAGVIAAAFLFHFNALGGFLLIVAAGHLAFFRDPERPAPPGEGLLSPADGTVVDIDIRPENRYLQQESVRIGIFMSVFVPHVNRSPMKGEVCYLHYVPGKFLNAFKREASELNESHWMGIEQGTKKMLVRQVAGLIARRIRCDARQGQRLERGERFGIICYSSRVEIFIPKDSFRPTVRCGDRVKAGQTLLGEWT